MPNVKSLILVIMQFGLLALLFLLSSRTTSNGVGTMLAFLLFGMAMLLGVWALIAMRRHTFSVLPEPVKGGQLCQQGPYRWIRHPMYLAVILVGLACCLNGGIAWLWLVLLCLVAVLVVKLRREERLLREHYADYERYMHQHAALIPGLF